MLRFGERLKLLGKFVKEQDTKCVFSSYNTRMSKIVTVFVFIKLKISIWIPNQR